MYIQIHYFAWVFSSIAILLRQKQSQIRLNHAYLREKSWAVLNLGRYIYHYYRVKKLGHFCNRFGPFWSGPFRILAQ